MEEIRIRTAGVGDLGHVLHHRRRMFADMGWKDERLLQGVEKAAREYLESAMPRGEYRAWMAEAADGRVVGGGGIAIVPWPGSPDFPEPRRGWILGIYTEPEYRRRGVARRIMETIVAWCRSEGFCHVSLHASAEGRALYEELGFRPTNEMRLYLREPGAEAT